MSIAVGGVSLVAHGRVIRSRRQLPTPPFWSQAQVLEAQEACAELTYGEYQQLDGAPTASVCDCCACNARRNHAPCWDGDEDCDCFERADFVSCDPRVMCEHCGTCYCSVPDDDETGAPVLEDGNADHER